MDYTQLLKLNFWNNSVQSYLIAFGILIGLFIVLKIFKLYVLAKIKKWAKHTKNHMDDDLVGIADSVPDIFYQYLAFYAAIRTLNLPEIAFKIANVILIILAVYWATTAISKLVEFLLANFTHNEDKKEKPTSYFALVLIAKIILWSTGLLVILSNLGVNISAFVASLGIGGVAIALAVQNVLGDMFSSFSIYFDKPFKVGDFIIVGDHQGNVKKIGLKTTRIKALQGEEIVISNRELTSTRIRNFKKMKKRRIVFGFGVTYDTPLKKLKAIPEMIKELINKIDLVEFDRAHFHQFGDFSLNFEVVYFLNSSEYNDYMNTQQSINFAIKEVFEKEKIEMAFPTQTIHIQK